MELLHRGCTCPFIRKACNKPCFHPQILGALSEVFKIFVKQFVDILTSNIGEKETLLNALESLFMALHNSWCGCSCTCSNRAMSF